MAQTNVQVFSGNVGVGTDAPDGKIHTRYLTPTEFTGITHQSSDVKAVITNDGLNGTNGSMIQVYKNVTDRTPSTGDFHSETSFQGSNVYTLCLNPRGGRIGLNDLNPNSDLTMGARIYNTTGYAGLTGDSSDPIIYKGDPNNATVTLPYTQLSTSNPNSGTAYYFVNPYKDQEAQCTVVYDNAQTSANGLMYFYQNGPEYQPSTTLANGSAGLSEFTIPLLETGALRGRRVNAVHMKPVNGTQIRIVAVYWVPYRGVTANIKDGGKLVLGTVGNFGTPEAGLTFRREYETPTGNELEPRQRLDNGIAWMTDLSTWYNGALGGNGINWHKNNDTYGVSVGARIWYQPGSFVSAGGGAGNCGSLYLSAGHTTSASNTPAIAIKSNGNVGIGTASPPAKLSVVTAGTQFTDLRLQSDLPYNNSTWVRSKCRIYFVGNAAFVNGDNQNNYGGYIQGGFRDGYNGGQNWSNAVLSFHTKIDPGYDIEAMTITNGGRVGIGTADPGAPFVVMNQVDTVNVYNKGIMKLMRGPDSLGEDKLWIGFSHGTSSADTNDRARIGTHIITGGGGDIFFTTGSGGTQVERMRINHTGLIGLGSSFYPTAKVHVKTEATASMGGYWSPGDLVVSHGVGTGAPGASLGVGIGVDYGGNSGSSTGYIWCMRPNETWNRLFIQGNEIVLNGLTSVTLGNSANVTSDDRLKTDEALIKNATSTLMKLKPQTYNKHKNLPNSSDEHRLDDAGIPYNKSVMEAGLIVQDVYYDAPELKHLVLLSDDAIPQETKPEEPVPGDIQQDPDYSDWGVRPSGLNYTGLTPYIIKSIQEINMELPHHKTKIDGISFSNISAYHNLIVSKDSAVRLSNTYNDKTVYGVISETEASTDDSEVLVNYQGDGKVWVINTSNIEAGDYITTSNVGGYGMKQGTDFTMNYTLAKSTIACDFTQPHIAEKRKIQELQDVTYWSVTQNVDISKKRYDFIASNNVNLVSTTTETSYSNVIVEELTGNTVYSNITTQEYSALESDKQNNYTEVSETKYHFISTREYSLDPRNETSNVIVRQEYVDVLDGNGQLQWEDTGNTVPMYELRYLNSDGIQTDEANAVYKAALIECTFKTG